jgi:hypothetical protein
VVPRSIRYVLPALALLAAVGCAVKPVLMPVAVPCPAPTVPPRPVIECCLPADTDAECMAKAIKALVLLEGYSAKLEELLAAYAAKPPAPAPTPKGGTP